MQQAGSGSPVSWAMPRGHLPEDQAPAAAAMGEAPCHSLPPPPLDQPPPPQAATALPPPPLPPLPLLLAPSRQQEPTHPPTRRHPRGQHLEQQEDLGMQQRMQQGMQLGQAPQGAPLAGHRAAHSWHCPKALACPCPHPYPAHQGQPAPLEAMVRGVEAPPGALAVQAAQGRMGRQVLSSPQWPRGRLPKGWLPRPRLLLHRPARGPSAGRRTKRRKAMHLPPLHWPVHARSTCRGEREPLGTNKPTHDCAVLGPQVAPCEQRESHHLPLTPLSFICRRGRFMVVEYDDVVSGV